MAQLGPQGPKDEPIGLPKGPPMGPAHIDGTMIVETLVRLSTPRSRTTNRPSAPDLVTPSLKTSALADGALSIN